MHIKFNAFILSCLLFFVTPLLAFGESNSFDNETMSTMHTARIITPKAIIYADEILNTPLGYITNGKTITVGNPRKKNLDVYPLIVYGRIAYIESSNIQLEDSSQDELNLKRGVTREHNVDIMIIKPEERLSENNSAYFNLQQFGSGSDTKNLFNTVDGVARDNFLGVGIALLHRQSTGRLIWGAGYEYDYISSENIKLDLYILSPAIGYTPIKNSLFLLDLIYSFDFSLFSKLDIKNNFSTEPTPFFWGSQLNARLVFFPNQAYHAHLALGLRDYGVQNTKTLLDKNDTKINGIKSVKSVNLALGLAIEI